jgi:hypothetical protein
MAIELNPEQENVVAEAIRAGLIRAVDDVAEVGVAAIRQRLIAGRAVSGTEDADRWFQELTAWSTKHKLTPLLPDEAMDRESIYGECGL